MNLVPLNVNKGLLNVNIAMFVKCFLKILRLQKNFLQSMVHEGLTNMNFDNVSESSENVATSYIVFKLSYVQSISIDFTFFQRVFDYVQ